MIQKNVLKEFGENTSLHGVRFLTSTSRLRRVIWFLAITGSLSYCGTHIYECFSYYHSWPFNTVITVEREASLVFPAVTICNFNIVNLEELKILTKSDASNLEKELASISGRAVGDCNVGWQEKDDSRHPYFYKRGNFISYIINSTGHKLERMLSFRWPTPCLWKGKPCDSRSFTSLLNSR